MFTFMDINYFTVNDENRYTLYSLIKAVIDSLVRVTNIYLPWKAHETKQI